MLRSHRVTLTDQRHPPSPGGKPHLRTPPFLGATSENVSYITLESRVVEKFLQMMIDMILILQLRSGEQFRHLTAPCESLYIMRFLVDPRQYPYRDHPSFDHRYQVLPLREVLLIQL